MKEVATFLQNVLQGEAAVSVEVREGRGRCLVASKQIEVKSRSTDVMASSLQTDQNLHNFEDSQNIVCNFWLLKF